MKSKTRKRIGDKIITETSAIVQYDDIVASATIEQDDDCEAPWKDCDGWEHELVRCSYECEYDPSDRNDCFQDRNANYKWKRIELGDCGLADYDYFHAGGMSKQVAREKEANEKRRCIDQIKDWYENGWHVYQVCVDFTTDDGTSFSDSLGGCYDDDDATYCRKDVVPECVRNVVHELEKNGYTVEGQPDYAADRRNAIREAKLDQFKRNLASQNVAGRIDNPTPLWRRSNIRHVSFREWLDRHCAGSDSPKMRAFSRWLFS